jgi:hypothetical protein
LASDVSQFVRCWLPPRFQHEHRLVLVHSLLYHAFQLVVTQTLEMVSLRLKVRVQLDHRRIAATYVLEQLD